jgi:hypothetical protein
MVASIRSYVSSPKLLKGFRLNLACCQVNFILILIGARACSLNQTYSISFETEGTETMA